MRVVRGRRDGPRLFVSAAVHGDELNGVEIIRRLLRLPALSRLNGTLIAIPIVNVYGVLHHSRYLPDRRDLNRSFPGSGRGSLTAKVADRFMSEIVANCTHGIDLHTAANHRDNLPQIRGNLDDAETLSLARGFGVPVLINAATRDGSLRAAAAALGIKTLLYEAGSRCASTNPRSAQGCRGLSMSCAHWACLHHRAGAAAALNRSSLAPPRGCERPKRYVPQRKTAGRLC